MKINYICSCIVLLLSHLNPYAQDAEAGKNLFKTRCTSCHGIEKDLVGPALKDVNSRRTTDWIISFVHSSQAKVKSGDTAAIKLFEKYSQTVMPDQSDLKDNDIKNIVEYIKIESKQLASNTSKSKRLTELHPNYMPIRWADYWFWASFALCVMIIIWILFIRIKYNINQ